MLSITVCEISLPLQIGNQLLIASKKNLILIDLPKIDIILVKSFGADMSLFFDDELLKILEKVTEICYEAYLIETNDFNMFLF